MCDECRQRQPDGDPDVMVDINTTPLIDVMLVLLIMLIITIPIQTHAVKLNMPVGTPPPPTVPPEVVTIELDFDGTVLWNGVVLPDRPALETRLQAPPQHAGTTRNPSAPEQAGQVRARGCGDGLGPAARPDQDRDRGQRAVRPLTVSTAHGGCAVPGAERRRDMA